MDITELVKLLSAKDEQINQLLQQVGNLQAQLENLLRILYGKKSEKKPPVAKASNNDATNVDSNAQSNKPKNKPIRKKLPEDLPRENIRYELTDSELMCTLCHIGLWTKNCIQSLRKFYSNNIFCTFYHFHKCKIYYAPPVDALRL